MPAIVTDVCVAELAILDYFLLITNIALAENNTSFYNWQIEFDIRIPVTNVSTPDFWRVACGGCIQFIFTFRKEWKIKGSGLLVGLCCLDNQPFP